jgi:hypothetical protein
MEALANTNCPLCGRPNLCAPAASGTLSSPCWCTQVVVDRSVLSRIPEEQRGQACICARCAAGNTGANDPA